MRGKGGGRYQVNVNQRITPACAGKSKVELSGQRSLRDHPRVCGEKLLATFALARCSGSPPRVRGKEWFRDENLQQPGITPACAGKSRFRTQKSGEQGDHPRVCGEKSISILFAQLEEGSPPRVRGKVFGRVYGLHGVGITPACAGKRLKRSHSIGHFSCILCLFHSVLHRASVSGGSRAGPCAPPCLPAQNAVPV